MISKGDATGDVGVKRATSFHRKPGRTVFYKLVAIHLVCLYLENNMRLDDGQIEVVDDTVAKILQAKTPWERLNIANGVWKSARQLIAASLRSRHPGWDEAMIAGEVSKRVGHGTH